MAQIPHSSSQAEQQALYWQAKLSSDLLSDADHCEFQLWLADGQQNAAAWESVNGFWTELDGIGFDQLGLDELGLDEWALDETASDRQGLQAVVADRSGKITPAPVSVRRWRPALALAASLLLATAVSYPQWAYFLADYRTLAGNQQQVQLEDGSSVLLNSDSAFSLQYAADRRQITLERGEAHFQVAADRERPFVVKTPAGEIRALGTAFDVRLAGDAARVTVFEHAVRITTRDGAVLVALAEGEQVAFDRRALQAAEPVDLQRAGAWQRQRMLFQDKPLAEVIAELDRYRPGKIVVVDRSIEKLRLTGVFDIADTDTALQAIEQSLPVRVRKIGARLVLLSAK